MNMMATSEDSVSPEASEVSGVLEFQNRGMEELGTGSDITNPTNSSRVQTSTGFRFPPPIIRVERCRCVKCGADPDLYCKLCKDESLYCKKCARRAKHPHPLKAFRPKDDTCLQLRKYLTLSYYEHIVACESLVCLETCEASRDNREHFRKCTARPRRLQDMILNGRVRFDAVSDAICRICSLHITFMFLHANNCQKSDCSVEWCHDMRDMFDMGSCNIHIVPEEYDRKCQEIHRQEWKKVEDRRQNILVAAYGAIAI
ncbi:hypothetical protein CAEBREN_13180 [Caenorhabditis brenneri]|uniref:TAZ-type domain-containing protein n=1 Tax=Caenorhabditis brenneri TaxID=135651 RepID=G0PL86_CAEBE|nr:hypothetical protein CAEBREN_13180 [Caenorhabditis brenneri]